MKSGRTIASPIDNIESYVWRLRRLLILMVIIISILPASIFFYLEIRHQRKWTQMYADHLAILISTHPEREGSSLEVLLSRFREDMERNRILSVMVIGTDGEKVLQHGKAYQGLFPITAEAQIFPQVQSVRSVSIQSNTGHLFNEVARVFGIHILVASLFIIITYTLPIKALQKAIADLKTAQAQIIHSDKLSAIGETYAGITHEINNPLGIILSRVKLLISSAKERQLPPDLLHDLTVIERHGTRIAEILRGLLSFSRRTPFKFVETDLNRVITEAISLVEKTFVKNGIKIGATLAPGLPAISGSPNHLQQVFLNLLNNARDAMSQGGQITIRTFRNRTQLIAEVSDNGTGIASDIREMIFEPFFTTKEPGKGTGLGLSVSYGIVRTHGGEITVESTPGKGSIFRVTLPVENKRQ